MNLTTSTTAEAASDIPPAWELYLDIPLISCLFDIIVVRHTLVITLMV